jgi:NAD(P)-dependent dehydrogenase (short-subunit alcohol dehydrogenase family)
MGDLQGKTALVTGATSGIGRAIAVHLAAAGADVVLHGRDAERGGQWVKEISEQGGQARFEAADLADSAEVLRLAAAAGDTDILVNSAGVYEFASTPATDAAVFDKHFAVNTRAPFLLVSALAPAMIRRGEGSIITVTSSAARSTAPVGAVYGASKAAAETLTRYWATEFGAHGIRANAVSSGPVLTEGTSGVFGRNGETVSTRINARGKVGAPEEIAQIVVFLAGPGSSYMNGAVLSADGGEVSNLPG